jgi:hypothetical protein
MPRSKNKVATLKLSCYLLTQPSSIGTVSSAAADDVRRSIVTPAPSPAPRDRSGDDLGVITRSQISRPRTDAAARQRHAGDAYTLSGVGIVLAAMAVLRLQAARALSLTGRVGRAILVHARDRCENHDGLFLLEGAGSMAAVGYFVGGEPVSAIATGVVIVAFWLSGPDVFAKA